MTRVYWSFPQEQLGSAACEPRRGSDVGSAFEALGWRLFEHMPFPGKLITLFITPAASGAIIITQLLRKK